MMGLIHNSYVGAIDLPVGKQVIAPTIVLIEQHF
jgi:hypothetical protein